MADLADVLAAIQTELTDLIYPTAQTVGSAVTVFDVEIGVGWPDDKELDSALALGRGYISIYPIDGERNTTPYEFTDTAVDRDPPGITVSYSSDTATAVFGGVAKADDVIGVVYKGTSYTYGPNVGDTAAQVAAAVAALMPTGAVIRTVLGTIVFAYAADAVVVSGNSGYYQRYLGTIERRIQLTMWAFDQVARDTLFQVIQTFVMGSRFIDIDVVGVGAVEQISLTYSASNWSDKAQNAGAYMRNMIVLASFPITSYVVAPVILFTPTTLNGQQLGPSPLNAPPLNAVTFKTNTVVVRGIPVTFTPSPASGI